MSDEPGPMPNSSSVPAPRGLVQRNEVWWWQPKPRGRGPLSWLLRRGHLSPTGSRPLIGALLMHPGHQAGLRADLFWTSDAVGEIC